MTHRVSLRLTFVRKAMIASAAILALAVPFVIGILRAQTLPPPPKYKYEVATIRPNKSGSQNIRISPGPQGGIRTENTSVLGLMIFAYDMRDFQFVGGPAWIRTERFDIIATPDKAEETPGPSMARDKFESHISRQKERMQALLAERFGLVLRVEKREQPYYSLTIAKGGSKLVATKDPDKVNMSTNRGRMTGTAIDMGMIARSLSNIVGRTVTDDTGLSGHYDLKIEWTPDLAATAPSDSPAALPDGASIFTALQEQLGLKLESKKGPVPVFVIEKVERPTEN